jgi:hypothetical protein
MTYGQRYLEECGEAQTRARIRLLRQRMDEYNAEHMTRSALNCAEESDNLNRALAAAGLPQE